MKQNLYLKYYVYKIRNKININNNNNKRKNQNYEWNKRQIQSFLYVIITTHRFRFYTSQKCISSFPAVQFARITYSRNFTLTVCKSQTTGILRTTRYIITQSADVFLYNNTLLKHMEKKYYNRAETTFLLIIRKRITWNRNRYVFHYYVE